MFPLNLANANEKATIKKIFGDDCVKKHLENMGFSVGENVSVISSYCGNVIVRIKDSRVAISAEMAKNIMV